MEGSVGPSTTNVNNLLKVILIFIFIYIFLFPHHSCFAQNV